MWKRDEAPRPAGTSGSYTSTSPESPVLGESSDGSRGARAGRDELVTIGKSIVIKGELSGGEDLTIDGQVEGKIELREHVVTIGPHGRINAQIVARSIIVLGQVNGNLAASEKVDIGQNGSVEGDIVAPRVAIADGAHFRGSIDMQRREAAAARPGRSNGSDYKIPVAASDELAGV